jgi:hypothetical protein
MALLNDEEPMNASMDAFAQKRILKEVIRAFQRKIDSISPGL